MALIRQTTTLLLSRTLSVGLVLVASCFAFSSVVMAHGGESVVQEKAAGNYIVEFEYEGEGPVIAGETRTYVFYLLDKDDREIVETESMFIRFEDSKTGTLVAGADVHSSSLVSGNGRISVALPAEGDYVVTAQFHTKDGVIVEAIFEHEVSASGSAQDSSGYSWLIFLLCGAALGSILQRALRKG